jgi:hypothetical protein
MGARALLGLGSDLRFHCLGAFIAVANEGLVNLLRFLEFILGDCVVIRGSAGSLNRELQWQRHGKPRSPLQAAHALAVRELCTNVQGCAQCCQHKAMRFVPSRARTWARERSPPRVGKRCRCCKDAAGSA